MIWTALERQSSSAMNSRREPTDGLDTRLVTASVFIFVPHCLGEAPARRGPCGRKYTLAGLLRRWRTPSQTPYTSPRARIQLVQKYYLNLGGEYQIRALLSIVCNSGKC